ncbi:MAG: hypothetical protein ACW981_01080 [Candidatus Hodarchaeales archaeon]
MSTVTNNSDSNMFIDSNQFTRPKGVIFISLVLALWVILDLQRVNGTTDVLLWSLVVFRVMVILGLISMSRWGYWMTMIYMLFQSLFSAPNIASIDEIASRQGLNSSLLSVRYITLIDLFWVYTVMLALFILVFFYLNARKDEFKY